MIQAAFIAGLGLAAMSGESELDALRRIESSQEGAAQTAEQLAYLYLRLGMFDRAEEYLNRRRQLGEAWQFDALYRGDLAYWRGDLAVAGDAYREAGAAVDPQYRNLVQERALSVLREASYRNRAQRAKRLSLWMGTFSTALLLLSPIVVGMILRGREKR